MVEGDKPRVRIEMWRPARLRPRELPRDVFELDAIISRMTTKLDDAWSASDRRERERRIEKLKRAAGVE